MSKIEITTEKVDNPYFSHDHRESSTNPRRIVVAKNIRESAIETLWARRKLDRAQKEAADKFRRIWESCGGTIGAMNYDSEPVDGGGVREPLSERQANAGRALAACRALLGKRPFELVSKVCGQGHSLQEVAPDQRARLTAADTLRNSLDDLCEMWGIIRRPRHKAG